MYRSWMHSHNGECERCGIKCEDTDSHRFDHMCKHCRWAYYKLKSQAQSAITKATKEGILTRPDKCELCGSTPGTLTIRKPKGAEQRTLIEAHHANGYESPLDIWWICRSCNQKMKGYRFHRGNLTRQQAREYLGIAVDK